MKLSEFVSRVEVLYPGEDPEIRVAGNGGFLAIDDILSRDGYWDESFFGDSFETGRFAVVETIEVEATYSANTGDES